MVMSLQVPWNTEDVLTGWCHWASEEEFCYVQLVVTAYFIQRSVIGAVCLRICKCFSIFLSTLSVTKRFFNIILLKFGTTVGIATCYGLNDQGIESPWWARFSTFVHTGPGSHPNSSTKVTESFPGVKRPGRGVDHRPASSAEVK
jgi:hypothetical protein